MITCDHSGNTALHVAATNGFGIAAFFILTYLTYSQQLDLLTWQNNNNGLTTEGAASEEHHHHVTKTLQEYKLVVNEHSTDAQGDYECRYGCIMFVYCFMWYYRIIILTITVTINL